MSEYDEFCPYFCGELLGDGSITKQKRRKPQFQFVHRVEDLEWANHCYKLLKNHIPLTPPTYRKLTHSRLK